MDCGGCLTASMQSNKSLWFSHVPMDVLGIVQSMTLPAPSLALQCRHVDYSEYVVYHPLDGTCAPPPRLFDARRNCIYGRPGGATWQSDRLTVTRTRPRGSLMPTVINVDVPTGRETVPDWAHGCSYAAGPTVDMGDDMLLLPRADESFEVLNTRTTVAMPTQLVYGTRNPDMGSVRLGARDARVSGMALLASPSGRLQYWSCLTNQMLSTSCPRGTDDPVSSLLSQPNSSVFWVGRGTAVHCFDMRTALQAQFTVQARYPTWPVGAFFSENAFATWDHMEVTRDRTFALRQHCQWVDVRTPTVWVDAPEWKTGAGFTALWASMTPHAQLSLSSA